MVNSLPWGSCHHTGDLLRLAVFLGGLLGLGVAQEGVGQGNRALCQIFIAADLRVIGNRLCADRQLANV
jgi:hypothetical protein